MKEGLKRGENFEKNCERAKGSFRLKGIVTQKRMFQIISVYYIIMLTQRYLHSQTSYRKA